LLSRLSSVSPSESPHNRRPDDRNEGGLRNDDQRLSPYDRSLSLTQSRSAPQLRVTLPERAQHHSGFLPRLKEARRSQTEWNRQDETSFARRSQRQHHGKRDDGDDQPRNAAASPASSPARTDVRNAISHASASSS